MFIKILETPTGRVTCRSFLILFDVRQIAKYNNVMKKILFDARQTMLNELVRL